jgi:hypothetical protein
VASMITCAQRLHTVRHSPGAADPMTPAREGRGEVESGDDAGQNGPRRSRAIRPKREPGKPGKSEQ